MGKFGGEARDDGQDAAQFFVGGQGAFVAEGRRAGAFAADVQDVRAGLGQRVGVADRRVRAGVQAAVGEGVGRDVEDAHDQGAPPQRLPPVRRCEAQMFLCLGVTSPASQL